MNLNFFAELLEKAKIQVLKDQDWQNMKKDFDEFVNKHFGEKSVKEEELDPILNEKELASDMEVMLRNEEKVGDAWADEPAMSYQNNQDGFINLRKMITLMAHRINSSKQDKFPEMLVFNETVYHFKCTNCWKNWWTGNFDRTQISITCPFCAYLGPLKPKEGA